MLLPTLCAAADAIDQQIERALQLRSAAPAEFNDVLSQLEAQAATASATQKRNLCRVC